MSAMEIGLYTIDLSEKLGQGTFGIVYKGRITKSGEPVAVKQLEIRTDDHGTQALEEIKKYERIPAHPNLLKLLDFHYKNKAFWLVLEHCNGGNLDEFAYNHNPDIPTQYQLMLQCARGITHMHRKEYHMVHRDVKPANIMISCEGDKLLIKLTDFGLAKDAQLATTIQMKSKVGSPSFMAPEVYEQKPYDAAVDVFALGLVFLGLLLRKENDEHIIPSTESMPGLIPVAVQMVTSKASNGKQPVVISVKASDNAKLKTVKSLINKMVVIDADKRVSAQEVVDALKSIVESEAITAPESLKKTAKAKGVVAIKTADGASGRSETPRPSFHRQDSLLEEVLKDKVKEKAKEEHSGEADDLLQQLLVGIPMIRMMGLVLSSQSSTKSGGSDDAEEFKVGERVRIESDEKTAKELQEGHGGWVDGMQKYLGRVGVIKAKILHVFKVEFDSGQTWSLNPALLHKLDGASSGSSSKQKAAPSESRFKGDDVVVVSKDEAKVKSLQKGHGGWNGDMAKCLGLKGIVHRVDSDGDVYVECINQDKWTFNPDVLELVDTSAVAIRKGSLVLVIDDYETVRKFQDDHHGSWNEAMRKVLGRAGTVKELLSTDCVKVEFSERAWAMNTKALKHIATEGEMVAAVLRKILE